MLFFHQRITYYKSEISKWRIRVYFQQKHDSEDVKKLPANQQLLKVHILSHSAKEKIAHQSVLTQKVHIFSYSDSSCFLKRSSFVLVLKVFLFCISKKYSLTH